MTATKSAGGRVGPLELGSAKPINWPDPKRGPWKLTLSFRLDDEGLRCTGIELARRDPAARTVQSVTHRVLREIPVAALTQVYGRHLVEEFRRMGLVHDEPALGALAEEVAVAAPGPPRASRARFYERVAAVYRKALDDGLPPTRAVQEAFGPGVSRATAATWVRRARVAGHLGGARGRG